MISEKFNLDTAIKEPNKITMDEWRYNDFKIQKRYQVILKNFPKRETQRINDRTDYYAFKGSVILEDDEIQCDKIWFSKNNFDNAFVKNENRKSIKKNDDIKITMIRKSKKVLSFFSIEVL